MTWDVIYWLSRKPFFFLLILGVDRRIRKSRPDRKSSPYLIINLVRFTMLLYRHESEKCKRCFTCELHRWFHDMGCDLLAVKETVFFLLILGVDRRLRKSRPISTYHKNLAGFNSCGLFSLRKKKKGKNSAAYLSYPTLVHSYSVCTGLKLSGSKPLIHPECLHFFLCVCRL